MDIKPLASHEIGSLAKPAWRVKAIAGKELLESDIAEAVKWCKRLEMRDFEILVALLEKRHGFSPDERLEIIEWSSKIATRFLEASGLDIIWDGEMHRVEMYEYPIKHIPSFEFQGHVRSFDNKYYRKAACVRKVESSEDTHTHEYVTIKNYTKKAIKIPITGAYTLVDWSFDSHYLKKVELGTTTLFDQRKEARSEFLTDVAKKAIYPNLKSLYEKGARFLQIDEPAATTKRNEIDLYIQSMIDSVGDLKGKAFFSVHICFSNYQILFPELLRLEGIIDEIHLEYANRDSRALGVNDDVRRGYDILKSLKDTKFKCGIGVVDIHTDFIEPPELIRDRILYAVDILEDPSRILVTPDCGLRTRTWDVTFQKLLNLEEGRKMALQQLGI